MHRGTRNRQRISATTQDAPFTLFPDDPSATIAATSAPAPIPPAAPTGLEAMIAKQGEALATLNKLLTAATTNPSF